MILSLPIFRAARARFPEAEIDVLCDPKNAGPVENTGLVDHVALYDKDPLRTVELVSRLRRREYDYVDNLVVYPSFTLGLLARLIGPDAVRAAGDQGEFSYCYNRLIDLPPKQKVHMLERLFLLAADITGPQISEIATPWVEFGNTIQRQAKELFSSVAARLSLNSNSPRLAAVNLSAGLKRREWPLEKYEEFLRNAVESFYPQVNGWMIITNPHAPEEAQELARLVNHERVHVLPGSNDFRVMMEFLRHVYLLITPDTSFVHAASAMGTPVLDLMIGENVTTWAPVGVPFQIVSSKNPFSLREVRVEEVLQGTQSLLNLIR